MSTNEIYSEIVSSLNKRKKVCDIVLCSDEGHLNKDNAHKTLQFLFTELSSSDGRPKSKNGVHKIVITYLKRSSHLIYKINLDSRPIIWTYKFMVKYDL